MPTSSERSKEHPPAAAGHDRQFVHFQFFRVDHPWRRLPEGEKSAGKKEFQRVVEDYHGRMMIRTYSLVGIRGDADFMLWKAADRLEDLNEFGGHVLRSGLGAYLTVPYAYLSMTKPSQYTKDHKHAGSEDERLRVKPFGLRYLFVYPFIKTRPWYRLDAKDRGKIMGEHFRVGHEFPGVKIHTSYSFGVDDQEFVLAFETDSPADYLDLVQRLRESEASQYTLRDTPAFTCVAADIGALLDGLG